MSLLYELAWSLVGKATAQLEEISSNQRLPGFRTRSNGLVKSEVTLRHIDRCSPVKHSCVGDP